jgi:hypothetical protein
MPRRKSVEAEPASAVLNAVEPKKPARKTASKDKAVAAHKHHSKASTEPAVETPAVQLAVTINQTITHESIARLAYSYWEARGFQGGCPDQDWFRAESELLKLA